MAWPPHSPTMPSTPLVTAARISEVPGSTSRTSTLPSEWWKLIFAMGCCPCFRCGEGRGNRARGLAPEHRHLGHAAEDPAGVHRRVVRVQPEVRQFAEDLRHGDLR